MPKKKPSKKPEPIAPPVLRRFDADDEAALLAYDRNATDPETIRLHYLTLLEIVFREVGERRERARAISKKGVKARREAAPEWQAEIRENVELRIRAGATDRAIAKAVARHVDRKDKVLRDFAALVRKEMISRKK